MPNSGDSWTVKDLARSIKPEWSFPDEWLFWPPDVFAFTWIVFQQTGCYSHVLRGISEPRDEESKSTKPNTVRFRWRRDLQWQDSVEDASMRWLEGINRILLRETYDLQDLLKDKEDFRQAVERIRKLAPKVTLEQLRLLTGIPGDPSLSEAQDLCEDLIFVHALADEACAGFGLPNAPPRERALAHYFANLLLTSQGSLSSFPKHHGIVLPKMHTPRSGLTLRSLSHHVTFHRSEVEVMWRATPWVNVQENTLNILCLPWPLKVDTQCFKPERETFESVRYFTYTPPECDDSYLDDFVELALRASETVSPLHMLVFPETALTIDDYKGLLWRFRKAHLQGPVEERLKHVPMIVAGVQQELQEGCSNEVRMAAYFAGRWYELSQRKHHRWKLDHNQIRQYNLQGRLSTFRDWYENTSIVQRRLTFLAPNGWLALCPLICEDLAQLEPMSDLIRGVGPNLVLALLLDGPQLKERWSARYASVFADDPGTAVLTLTSLGMATRSQRLEGGKPNEKSSRVVGLWRDLIRGWETLELGKDEDAHVLTISADWYEEYTADGRTDHGLSAVFKFEGTQTFPLSKLQKPDKKRSEAKRSDDSDAPDQEPTLPQEKWLRGWENIRELTAATYALDAAMQVESKHLDIILNLLLNTDHESEFTERVPQQILVLRRLLMKAQEGPKHVGVAAQPEESWPTKTTEWAAAEIREQLSVIVEAEGEPASYYKLLTEKAIEQLEAEPDMPADEVADDNKWISQSVSIAILAALHYRIAKMRRRPSPQHEGREWTAATNGRLTLSEAADLLEKIEKTLDKYA